MHLIDINDGGLLCVNAQGEVVYDQPSLAYFDGEQLTFGTRAMAKVKSQPQACASQYMGRLSDETLPSPMGDALNHADLIFYHLRTMAAGTNINDCVFVIPAYFSDEQLQLLLGIAGAADLNPLGFINSGLAQTGADNADQNFSVLDIGLRQGQLSSVRRNEQMLANQATANFDSLGLFSIVDAWLQEIANVFLDSIRFDPLHSATTEQQAFDQILTWINHGELPVDTRISVDIDGYSRSAEINSNQLSQQLEQQLDQLGLADTTHLVLTTRAAKVPMLLGLLEKRVASVRVSDSETYMQRAMELTQTFTPGQVERLNAYPVAAANNAKTTQADPQTGAPQTLQKPATHLLGHSAATPITAPLFSEFLDQDGLLRPNAKVKINGEPASRATLKHGDQVSFADQQWSAIHVE
jgi:hypothetical protein